MTAVAIVIIGVVVQLVCLTAQAVLYRDTKKRLNQIDHSLSQTQKYLAKTREQLAWTEEIQARAIIAMQKDKKGQLKK